MKTANIPGYDPFALPALPSSLVQALGLNAGGQAQTDAHLLAAMVPQADLFQARRKPDPSTHALITSLLTESANADDGEGAPEDGEEDKEAAQKVSPGVRGFLDGVTAQMSQELKKRAGGAMGRPIGGPPPKSTGVGTAATQIDHAALGTDRLDSVRAVMRLAKRRGTYSGKRAPWAPPEEASSGVLKKTELNSSGLPNSLNSMQNNSNGMQKLSGPRFSLGGLLGGAKATARSIGTGVRNLATGVTRPGDTLTPGTPAFDRLIPPVVQRNNAMVLPVRTSNAQLPYLPPVATTIPPKLRIEAARPAVAEATERAVAAINEPGAGGIYFGGRRADGVLAVRPDLNPRVEASSAAHEASHVLVNAAGYGHPAVNPLYRIPGRLTRSDFGTLRGVGDFVDELFAHTRGSGLPAAARYAFSGDPGYAAQIGRHSPMLGAAYRAGPYAPVVGGAAVAGGVGYLGGRAGLQIGPRLEPQLPPDPVEAPELQQPDPEQGRTKVSASSILLKLLAAKASSDQKDYDRKHSIMRELMTQRPDEFEKEPPTNGIQGITHKPTGFRLHLPQQIVPSGT